jgi:hypothetical protein
LVPLIFKDEARVFSYYSRFYTVLSDKIAASIDPRVFPERKDISIEYSPLLAEDDH